jgi:hypothetical protein
MKWLPLPKIALDTCVLPRQGKLRNVVMSAVLRISKQLSIEVFLPEVVLEESVNSRLEAASAVAERLGEAINQASKLLEIDPIYIPSAAEAAELWRQGLIANFAILPLDSADAREALFREVHRVPPAREGRGARDSAIWLTVRRKQVSDPDPMFFVSTNTDDFGDKQSHGLHPALESEIAEGYGPIEYFRSLDALLDRLATKIQIVIDNATVQLMAEDLLSGLISLGMLDDLRAAEDLAGGAVDVQNVRVLRSCSVQGVVLANCDIIALVTLRQSDKDEASAEHAERLLIRCRCWLELDEATSRPNALEVLEVFEVVPPPLGESGVQHRDEASSA